MAVRRRGRLALPGMLLVAVLALGSCAVSGRAAPVVPQAHPAPPPAATVTTQPVNGTREVNPRDPISVQAVGGTLDAVTLTSSDGKQVAGVLAGNGTKWTATEPLGYGKSYTWSGNARNPAGGQTPVTGSFTTVTPARQVRATLNIGDEQTVGVAAPIILQFAGPVQDKAAVQRALSVSTSVPTSGSWAWLPDTAEGSRIHWRPQNYWTPGTSVTVAAELYGVPYGRGSFGLQDLTLHFTIGRSQIVKADAGSHQIVVLRDGQQVASYPASYGLDSSTDRTTRSGTHIVMEKDQAERMVSEQYHYDLTEYWAVRISNNGEFIHANPASTSAQGNSNITHGCINLSTPDAEAYFGTALYGDPVEVTDTGVPLSADDGDIYDWAIPWDQWQSLSAV
jgi:lipoprotein-anchoring transpeptidase ErfK/SrfK